MDVQCRFGDDMIYTVMYKRKKREMKYALKYINVIR